MPDPITNAINSMLDHIHTIEQRLDEAQKQKEEDNLKASAAFEPHKKSTPKETSGN